MAQRIREQIAALEYDLHRCSPDDASGCRLRIERLQTALMRLPCQHFGLCFKCEQPIPIAVLLGSPERSICPACLKAAPSSDTEKPPA